MATPKEQWRNLQMGKETFRRKIKKWVSGIGWTLFLWGIEKTEEEYWKEIQLQENAIDPL